MYRMFGRFAATGAETGGVGDTPSEQAESATTLAMTPAMAAPTARSLGTVGNVDRCDLELCIVI